MNKHTLRVVKIVDPYRIVINVGSEHGLTISDKVAVYAEGQPVVDPETKQVLGTLDRIKAYLNVEFVYDKMSLCINAKTKLSTSWASLATAALDLTGDRAREPMDVDPKAITGGWETGDTTIRIGDPVRIVKAAMSKTEG